MEQTGYGVLLVAEKYGKDAFEFLDFFLRVTLPFAYELENDDTQDDTQGDTQVKDLDTWIENEIRNNPKITTEELARRSKRSAITIKRHIAKLTHIKFKGRGYSGHWEIISAGDNDKNAKK